MISSLPSGISVPVDPIDKINTVTCSSIITKPHQLQIMETSLVSSASSPDLCVKTISRPRPMSAVEKMYTSTSSTNSAIVHSYAAPNVRTRPASAYPLANGLGRDGTSYAQATHDVQTALHKLADHRSHNIPPTNRFSHDSTESISLIPRQHPASAVIRSPGVVAFTGSSALLSVAARLARQTPILHDTSLNAIVLSEPAPIVAPRFSSPVRHSSAVFSRLNSTNSSLFSSKSLAEILVPTPGSHQTIKGTSCPV